LDAHGVLLFRQKSQIMQLVMLAQDDRTRLFLMGKSEKAGSAAFRAARHDGGVEALAKVVGKFKNLIRSVDLDGLAGGIEGHLAVRATSQVSAKLVARFSRYRVVDHVVEKGEKLFAGHFPLPVSLSALFPWK
jgi:hypothetical protein